MGMNMTAQIQRPRKEKHLGKNQEQGRKRALGEENVTETKEVAFSEAVNGQLNETEYSAPVDWMTLFG